MDDATLQYYRDNAQSYADWVKSPSTRLVRFMGLLPAGGSVLELGCGAGNHSLELIKAGFDVRTTDGSPEMAEIASRRLGRPVETLLFDQLDAQECYDGVWASACLLHAPRNELGGILGRIRRALKPSGVFYASYKIGGDDGRDKLGRYYNYPARDWLDAAYAGAGAWQPIGSDTSEIKGFDDKPATMLHLMVRKRAN